MTTYFTAGAVSAEIKARLSAILLVEADPLADPPVEAGIYETNIGREVMMGRRKIPGDDQAALGCVQVIEGGDLVQSQPGRIPLVLISQQYLIDAFDTCDPDNPNDKALAMIRDIKRAIFKDGVTWGDKVKEVEYISRDIGPRPDGIALVQVRVTIAVRYVEDLANP